MIQGVPELFHLVGVIIDHWSFTQLSSIVWSWVLTDRYAGAVE